MQVQPGAGWMCLSSLCRLQSAQTPFQLGTVTLRHFLIFRLISLSLSVAGLCFASGRTCEWHASENYEDVQAVQVAFEGWMFRIAPIYEHARTRKIR